MQTSDGLEEFIDIRQSKVHWTAAKDAKIDR